MTRPTLDLTARVEASMIECSEAAFDSSRLATVHTARRKQAAEWAVILLALRGASE